MYIVPHCQQSSRPSGSLRSQVNSLVSSASEGSDSLFTLDTQELGVGSDALRGVYLAGGTAIQCITHWHCAQDNWLDCCLITMSQHLITLSRYFVDTDLSILMTIKKFKSIITY